LFELPIFTYLKKGLLNGEDYWGIINY
jgi:hypothetical protein